MVEINVVKIFNQYLKNKDYLYICLSDKSKFCKEG